MGLADREYMRRHYRELRAEVARPGPGSRTRDRTSLAGAVLLLAAAGYLLWLLSARDRVLNPGFWESMLAHFVLSWENLRGFRLHVLITHTVSIPDFPSLIMTGAAAATLGPVLEGRVGGTPALRAMFGVAIAAGCAQLAIGHAGIPGIGGGGPGLVLTLSESTPWQAAPGVAWALVLMAAILGPRDSVRYLRAPVWLVAGAIILARLGHLLANWGAGSAYAAVGILVAWGFAGVACLFLRRARSRGQRAQADELLRRLLESR